MLPQPASGNPALKVLLADGQWYAVVPRSGGLRQSAREFEFLTEFDGREVLVRGPLHGLMAVMEEPGPMGGEDIPVFRYRPPVFEDPGDWDDDIT